MNQFSGVPENVEEKKNYELMSFHQLETDPITGPVLQQVALEYLKTHDKDWFYRKFTGELDNKGFLIATRERYEGLKPSNNIAGALTGPSEEVAKLSLIHISEPTRRTPIS